MRVVITDQAEADLEDIFDHIAADSPANAVSYVQELRAKARSLGQVPRLYRLRPTLGAGLRLVPHRSHVIVYRVARHYVEVLRVPHGAMDLESLLRK